jgi:iron complex transport system substrate-binding protein
LGECLVGRSHECDYPAEAQRLPVCTHAEIDSSRPSEEIDQQIKERVARGLSIYRLDGNQLRALRPDVLITQDQCGVCAVPQGELEKLLATFPKPGPRLLSLSPQRLPDIWANIQTVADILGSPESGRVLLKQLKNRVADVILLTAPLKRRPKVLCLEWLEPLMAAGNWVPELVDLAGGTPLSAEAGKHSSWLTWEEIAAQDPEVIVVMPCGFDLARTTEEMGHWRRNPGWSGLRAVRDGRVALVDGSHFFNRPGPRLVESLEILLEIFHPRLGSSDHAGRFWRLAERT